MIESEAKQGRIHGYLSRVRLDRGRAISARFHRNKAVYTAISVACGWAGAVMSLCKPQNSEIRDRKLDDTDQPTNRVTDGPT